MSLFEKAIQAIDNYNKKDPNTLQEAGVSYPKEYLNAIRQSNWLNKLDPQASDTLKIAARSQHIGRWEISRDSYPQTRSGYLQWRADLGKHHAEKSAEILKELGYDDAVIERVKELNLKKNIKLDPEAQAIEDMLCLVFLEFQIEEFAGQHDKEKMINIIQKTWKKMGEKGRSEALKINYSPSVAALLQEALS